MSKLQTTTQLNCNLIRENVVVLPNFSNEINILIFPLGYFGQEIYFAKISQILSQVFKNFSEFLKSLVFR